MSSAVNISSPFDPAAVRGELEQHHAASFSWALGCCRHDRADAEDVLQSAYVKVLTGKARYDGRAAFKSWLFAVIRKTAIDHQRRAIFRRGFFSDPVKSGAAIGSPEPVEGPDRPVVQRLFTEALATLPARQREVLHLVFYQHMSVQEAADIMQVSVGSARTHYERGKRRLRTQLNASPIFHESGLARPSTRAAF